MKYILIILLFSANASVGKVYNVSTKTKMIFSNSDITGILTYRANGKTYFYILPGSKYIML